MPVAACSDKEFMELFEFHGASKLARVLEINTRSVYARRRTIENKHGKRIDAPTKRGDLHRQPGYYPLRNHIVDFLVTRSRLLAGQQPPGWTGRDVPEIRPSDFHEQRERVPA